MKINKLTTEQQQDLASTRDKWLSIGLSTAPIDREVSKAAVIRMYECAGLSAPRVFVYLDSPQQGAIGAAVLKDSRFGAQVRAQVWAQVGAQVGAQVRDQVRAQVRAQVRDQVRAQVRAQVWAQVWAQVGAQVRDQVRDQVGDQVRDQVEAQVWDQVRDQVEAQVGAQVRDQVRAQVRDQVGSAVFGSHDAHWLGLYEFFNKHFGLAEKALGLMEVCKVCGWVWPFLDAVIITDRPTVIRFDDDKRLHCEDGPAIRYRDGFSVYSWRGQRVPAEWIKDKASLTAKIALTHENIEQRRAACEILGWTHILNELNATTIDKDDDPEIGELVEVDIPAIGRERFVRVMCGTKRVFALPVPPDMQTALQANSWTYGIDAETLLQKEVRT